MIDPIDQYRLLAELRDARFDSIDDPELEDALVGINRDLIQILRRGIDILNALNDDDPGKRARRIAETSMLRSIIIAMGGAVH
jgi:hypothetical protein